MAISNTTLSPSLAATSIDLNGSPLKSSPLAKEPSAKDLQAQVDAKTAEAADLAAKLAAKETENADLVHRLSTSQSTHKSNCDKLDRRNVLLASRLRSSQKRVGQLSFDAFCDRLLITNRAWRAERELKALRVSAIESHKHLQEFKLASAGYVEILEAKVDSLEQKRLSRIASEDLFLDEETEIFVEGLIRDIIVDLEESQRHATQLMEDHAREVEEINQEWESKNRSLIQEIEGLKVKLVSSDGSSEGSGEAMFNEIERMLLDETIVVTPNYEMDKESDDGSSIFESSSEQGSPTPTVLGDIEDFALTSDPIKLSSMELVDDTPAILTDPLCKTVTNFAVPCRPSPTCRSPTFHFTPSPAARPQMKAKRSLSGLPIKMPLWPGKNADNGGITRKRTDSNRSDKSTSRFKITPRLLFQA